MNITVFFQTFFGFFAAIFELLNTKAVFIAFGVPVSVLQIIVALLIVSMVVTIFWRGARG